MPQSDTDQLAALVDAKHACLGEIRALGQQQLEMVRDGRLTALLDVLAVKQQTVARLQQIERALDPFRHEDPESRRWASAEARGRCASRLAESESLLAEIVAREKECETELVRRRDEAAGQLQRSHTAAQARRVYLDVAPRGARRLDVTSGS